MQSMRFWSLNQHDTTKSLGLSHAPISLKSTPTRTSVTVRVHPYAHPQHLKVLRHFFYIQYGCGMQLMGVWSLNHDTATSYRLGHTQFFLNIHPNLHNV